MALVVAAVAYSSWVLAGWANPPLNSVDAYASELAATDQPSSWLFRGGDLVAGAAALVAGLLLRRRSGPAVEAVAMRPRLAWWCVAAFGAFTVLDAGLFPMACAPTIDAACAAAESAGEVPLRHQIHTVTSSLAAAAPLVGIAAFAWVRRGVVDVALCGLMVAATAATVVTAATHDWVGAAQRAQLAVIAVWLLWLARRVHREWTASTPASTAAGP